MMFLKATTQKFALYAYNLYNYGYNDDHTYIDHKGEVNHAQSRYDTYTFHAHAAADELHSPDSLNR
jgi:hypothetical protein